MGYGIEKKKSIPFIMECNACLIKDKLVSQNPMEIILLPQKSWIRPKQILTLKEIRTELQINRNEQWRRPFSDPYQLPRFCMSGRFQRLLEFFWPTRPHNSTFLHIMIFRVLSNQLCIVCLWNHEAVLGFIQNYNCYQNK